MNGLGTAAIRAITSIPGHCVFGIFMGMYLGLTKLSESRGDQKRRKVNMCKALIIPALIHGFYDCMLMIGSVWSMLLFLIFVVGLDYVAIKMLNTLEERDLLIPAPKPPFMSMPGNDPKPMRTERPGNSQTPERMQMSGNSMTPEEEKLAELERKYK